MRNRITVVAVFVGLAAICTVALAQGTGVLVKGTVKYPDDKAAANLTIHIIKVTKDGREIVIERAGKPMPPLASTKTDKDGKFEVRVPENQFGGMIMRFGFKVPAEEGARARYLRTSKGKVLVVETEFGTPAVDLNAEKKTAYVKR